MSTKPAHLPTRSYPRYYSAYGSIVAIAWIIISSRLAGAEAVPSVGVVPQKISALMCGPNSLYFLLRLYGLAPSFEAIVKQMTPDERGVSLADLASASTAFGLAAEPRQLELSELVRRRPSPFIAYCDPGNTDIGHFVVVLSVNQDAIFVVDGTSFQLQSFSLEQFASQWRGYALMPKVRKDEVVNRYATASLCASALFWISFSGVIAIRRWQGVIG